MFPLIRVGAGNDFIMLVIGSHDVSSFEGQ